MSQVKHELSYWRVKLKKIYIQLKKNEPSQHGSICQIYDPSNEIVITP
jgi:hypothetical protein